MRRAAILLLMIVAACGPPRAMPEVRSADVAPRGLWGGAPEGPEWSAAVVAALAGPGAPLIETVPEDIGRFCPAFATADAADRKAFWVAFLSKLAEVESTWREDVSGGGGRWHGLLQISPATAQGYGCEASTPEALKSGPRNLACAVRIMGVTVARDGVIAEAGGGVAADWGPLSRPEMADEIAAFTRRQGVCQGEDGA